MKKINVLFSLIIIFSMPAYAQIGTIDPTFTLGTGFGPDQWTGKCEVIAQQADGKLIVGGQYKTFNGEPSLYITRLNIDGTKDQNFNSPLIENWGSTVNTIGIQNDGKILIGGNFTTTDGSNQIGIARLNSNGSIDPTFISTTTIQNVSTLAIQSDGKIVLGNLVRLNQDGSIDNSFNAGTGISGSTGFGSVKINKILIQADGKIIIGGHYGSYNGTPSTLLTRLNSDGSIDNTFNANSVFSPAIDGFYGQVYDMKLLPDGKIMIGGNYGNSNSNGIGVDRLNIDGTLDNSFQVTHLNSDLRNFAFDVQSDGKVVVANVNFGAQNEAFKIERYNSDGTLEEIFSHTFVNNDVKELIVQQDGNITFVGYFNYNPTGIMRLIGDTPSTTSINENLAINFNLFPNPAEKNIFINDLPANSNIKITDLKGKIILETKNYNKAAISVDISTLSKGMYMLAVENNQQLTIRKFTKD